MDPVPMSSTNSARADMALPNKSTDVEEQAAVSGAN